MVTLLQTPNLTVYVYQHMHTHSKTTHRVREICTAVLQVSILNRLEGAIETGWH